MKRDRWQEISQIYHDALELPAGERETFLKTFTDEDLRCEVRALLSDETRLKEFLENPALEVASRLKKEGPSLIDRHLGSYHIMSELGRGGMGEVYRAKDQKLGRDVAIKVLPQEFAKNAERVSRFQREARLLASLNHPNIAAIHGLEESGGVNFLVLELVEGETLREQLQRGPIPVEEALRLAIQIAEALGAAHDSGIIHRDLKPANISITPDGMVKVLDFGLAKAFAPEQEVNLSNSPTLSTTATRQGVILGTAAYMSPEQARGRVVDKRVDIWAFGCVLYEMLTGRAAFQGEDVGEILASVIKGDLHLDLLPANIHPRLHDILIRCIQKDRKKRYRDVGDIQFDLEQILADPTGTRAQPRTAVEHQINLRRVLPRLAAALVLGAIVAGVAAWKLKPAPPSEPKRVMRFEYYLPEDQQFNLPSLPGTTIAISNDGSKFVYSTSKGLYLRSMEEPGARLIPGTESDPQSPFFSPDGKWLGYWSQADKKLKKIAIGGGVPVSLCDAGYIHGSIWYDDNKIVYADIPTGILRVSANGGTPEILIKGLFSDPQLLPDGKSILFTDCTSINYRVLVQQLASGARKELFAGGGGQYLPTGHIIYGLGTNLLAVSFDLDKLEVKSGPVPLIQDIRANAISDNGTYVFIAGKAPIYGETRTLVWADRNGKEEPAVGLANYFVSPSISPDGYKVVLGVGERSENSGIWIGDLRRKTLMRVTYEKGWHHSPIWVPDGKRIVFSKLDSGLLGIYWMAADGSGKSEKLASAPDRHLVPYCFSKDGKILIMESLSKDMLQWDIAALSMDGNHTWKPMVANGYRPQISPDGRWMAYASTESGTEEIYICQFPDVDKGKWQVSMGGGHSPLWSPDGNELFYINGDSAMGISIKTEPDFSLGTPRTLFRGSYLSPVVVGNGSPWDISGNGKRFLMIKDPLNLLQATGGPRKINIVLNWLEELKQRVPVK